MVIFTDIKPTDLEDPYNPPAKAKGPYVISGNNRYLFRSSHLHRLTLCKEIIAKNLHPNPDLFRKFLMSIYCFPKPKDAAQVLLLLFFTVLGCPHLIVGLSRKRAESCLCQDAAMGATSPGAEDIRPPSRDWCKRRFSGEKSGYGSGFDHG